MNTTGNNKSVFNKFYKSAAFALALAPALYSSALALPVLQGQNKGDTTNWYTGNLQGWGELEYIPMRVYFSAGSAGTQTVRVDFPHLNGKLFGVEDLADFTASAANITFVSAPKLTTDPSGVWSYTFTVNVSDGKPAAVRFFARMAAGAHLNGGSSLQLRGTAGNLHIHKPGPASGAPNLAVSLIGPAAAAGSTTILYTLSYTNKALTFPAMASQLSMIIDPQLVADTSSLGANARVVGNTIFWDLGNLAPLASGEFSILATVNPAAPVGLVMTNTGLIYSSENDLDMQDNSAVLNTSVICGSAAAAIVANPANVTVCPGDGAAFSTKATGPGQLTYQWRKDGAPISGATSTSFSIAAVGSGDVGTYDVLVTSPCDVVVSSTAELSLRPGLPLIITREHFDTDGSFIIEFGTVCGGTYVVEYSNDLVTWKTSPQTATGNGLTVEWRDAGEPATDSMPSTLTDRFYRVRTAF